MGREWVDIIDSSGTEKGNFLMRGVYEIPVGRWDDYITLRKGQDQLHQQTGGLQYIRNFRQLDEDNSALLLIRKTSREDHMKYMESPLLTELRAKGPQGTFTTRGHEYYEIIEEIARGGMGVVFRAKQISLNRNVALKMILSSHFIVFNWLLRFINFPWGYSPPAATCDLNYTHLSVSLFGLTPTRSVPCLKPP